MLRAIVVALLVANAGFYAWTQGWLDAVTGWRSDDGREPERLARQVHPELIRVITPQAMAAAARAAESRLQCLEAGPFAAPEATAAEAALGSVLPSGTWVRLTTDRPAQWIVYMGRFSAAGLLRKQEELSRIQVPFEPVRNAPELEPGLALGRFLDRGEADEALAALVRRGIRTARVVQVVKPQTVTLLRVDRADADLAAKVSGLKLDALGKGFGACSR